jgi:large subunit ribosomal protein L32
MQGGAEMAVPKRKTSKARRDKRRNNVWKLDAPAIVKCPQCGEYKRAHRLCASCGYYGGKQIIAVGE